MVKDRDRRNPRLTLSVADDAPSRRRTVYFNEKKRRKKWNLIKLFFFCLNFSRLKRFWSIGRRWWMKLTRFFCQFRRWKINWIINSLFNRLQHCNGWRLNLDVDSLLNSLFNRLQHFNYWHLNLAVNTLFNRLQHCNGRCLNLAVNRLFNILYTIHCHGSDRYQSAQ